MPLKDAALERNRLPPPIKVVLPGEVWGACRTSSALLGNLVTSAGYLLLTCRLRHTMTNARDRVDLLDKCKCRQPTLIPLQGVWEAPRWRDIYTSWGHPQRPLDLGQERDSGTGRVGHERWFIPSDGAERMVYRTWWQWPWLQNGKMNAKNWCIRCMKPTEVLTQVSNVNGWNPAVYIPRCLFIYLI